MATDDVLSCIRRTIDAYEGERVNPKGTYDWKHFFYSVPIRDGWTEAELLEGARRVVAHCAGRRTAWLATPPVAHLFALIDGVKLRLTIDSYRAHGGFIACWDSLVEPTPA